MTTIEDTWAWIQPALAELGNHDHPWQERVQHVLEQLGLSQPEENPVTAELFQRLDAMSEDERDGLGEDQLMQLAYEIVTSVDGATGQEPAGAQGGYDEGAWQQFLVTNGTSWDGTEEAWPAFRTWFEYTAGEQGLQQPANDLLQYLDSMSTGDRIAAFAQYGVTIAAPEQAGGGAQAPGTPAVEEDSAELDALADELADQLAEIPGIEDMTDEEIEQILSATMTEGGS